MTSVETDAPDEQLNKICSTVNDPDVVTVMDCVVSPVDHRFPLEADEVRVTEPPSQKVVGPPAVMVGTVGIGFTVTLVAEAAGVEQPNPLDTCRE